MFSSRPLALHFLPEPSKNSFYTAATWPGWWLHQSCNTGVSFNFILYLNLEIWNGGVHLQVAWGIMRATSSWRIKNCLCIKNLSIVSMLKICHADYCSLNLFKYNSLHRLFTLYLCNIKYLVCHNDGTLPWHRVIFR